MSERNRDSDKIKGPRVAYRTLLRLGRRRPVAEVMNGLAEIINLTKGKDAVTLVREERNR
jgi:hypothetical protein